jgi:beta-fructofuranosidase
MRFEVGPFTRIYDPSVGEAERGDAWLLFVCTNRGYNETAVYESGSPFAWREADRIGVFAAHAAEVIPIEPDRWLVSRAGWGQGGLYLAELNWLD